MSFYPGVHPGSGRDSLSPGSPCSQHHDHHCYHHHHHLPGQGRRKAFPRTSPRLQKENDYYCQIEGLEKRWGRGGMEGRVPWGEGSEGPQQSDKRQEEEKVFRPRPPQPPPDPPPPRPPPPSSPSPIPSLPRDDSLKNHKPVL